MPREAPDLDHLSIPVTDLERSARFYVDTLGMRVLFREPGIVMLRAGRGTDFALQRADGPVDPRGHKLHFGFKVASADEVARWEEHVRARGVPGIESELQDPHDPRGPRQLYFRDPDGYLFEIYYPGP